MARRPRRRLRSQAESATYITVQRGHDRASIIKELIRYGCFGWLGWLVFKSVPYLSGRATNVGVSISADLLGSDTAVRVLFLAVGGALLFLWRREKKLNVELIQHHGEDRRSTELEIDPRRSSSGLLPSGENTPDDPI